MDRQGVASTGRAFVPATLEDDFSRTHDSKRTSEEIFVLDLGYFPFHHVDRTDRTDLH